MCPLSQVDPQMDFSKTKQRALAPDGAGSGRGQWQKA